MSEILQQYLNVIPTLLEAIKLDVMVGITDGSKFLGYFPGKKMVANIHVNDPVPSSDPLTAAFRTGRKISSVVPSNTYGFSFNSISIPIRDEGKIVGALGVAVSLEREEHIFDSFENMHIKINHIHEDIEKVQSFTNNVNNEVQIFTDLLTGITSSFDDMRKSAEGIKSIASQSNILSLNASIEAARAGEHGNGFAIVAKQMQEHSNSTKASSEEVISILGKIHKDIEKVNKNLSMLNESFSIQSNAIGNMGSMLNELDALSNTLAQYIKEN